MLELKGKYCKDCKIFTDNIEQEALSMVYRFLDNPMFEGSKIRIMPDVHAGKDIVVGFTVPFSNHVNPDHVGGDIGCSVSTVITNLAINADDYEVIEKNIRENVKFGMTIHQKAVYPYAELYKHLNQRLQQARQQWPEMVGNADVSEKGILLHSSNALTRASICSTTALALWAVATTLLKLVLRPKETMPLLCTAAAAISARRCGSTGKWRPESRLVLPTDFSLARL